MDEDDVIILEDGKKICTHCIAGELVVIGGPVKVGIPGVIDSNVLFLHTCDICGKLYKLKNEKYRQKVLKEYAGEYGLPICNDN